jgi:thiopurine S-methyltransferase
VEADFWHERWRSGRIGFHQEKVSPALKCNWPSLGLTIGSSVLVPLCGKSLDLLWLENSGYGVVGVELSDVAIESFCMENAILARRRDLNRFQEYQAANLRLLCGDFFQLTASDIGVLPHGIRPRGPGVLGTRVADTVRRAFDRIDAAGVPNVAGHDGISAI